MQQFGLCTTKFAKNEIERMNFTKQNKNDNKIKY